MKHTTTRAPRFDREWKEIITLLPEHRQSLMEQAIRAYQLSGTEPEGLDGTEMMAFLLIKKIVDRRAKQRLARMNKKEASHAMQGGNLEQKAEISHDEPSAEPKPEPRQEARSQTPIIAKKKQSVHGPLGDINRLRRESLAKKRIKRHFKNKSYKRSHTNMQYKSTPMRVQFKM